MNYRCIFPINIRKNLLNANSPFITNVQHKTETLLGQYSFVKANISPLKTSKVGLTYSQKGTRGEGLPNQVMSLSSQNKGGSTS